MIIKYFDITLKRICYEDIEEIRYWRNTDKIKSKMEFRNHISKKMQQQWFKKINDINFYLYLVIIVEGKKIGLIHAKDFSCDNTEAGMFIWDDNYINSHVPVVVSLALTDWAFFFLGNTHIYCKMLRSNKHAIVYNQKLGYKLCKNQQNKENQLYKLTLEDYQQLAFPLRNLIGKIYNKEESTINMLLELEDKTNGVGDFILEHFKIIHNSNCPVKFNVQYI